MIKSLLKESFEILKKYLEHILLVGVGFAFMFIFISIALTGGYTAREPNQFILGTEIFMGISLAIFGIIKIISCEKQRSGNK